MCWVSELSFIRRFFKKSEEIEIFSKKPVAKFRVERVFNILGKPAIIGEVLEGIIYPGYKIKGKDVALIRKIQKDHRDVDFAIEYDRVALLLEGNINVKENEILEVYQS